MKKILFLILTTKHNEHRQRGILSSWGRDQDIFFYSEHEDETLNVIKVCEENNVVKKQVSVFNKIKELFHNQYEWFFFGDDDTFVNTRFLLEFLDFYEKGFVNGVPMTGNWKLPDGTMLSYPSGGAGFLINNEIIHNFFDFDLPDVPHSDVAVGYLMRESGIILKPISLFCYNTPEHHHIEDHHIPDYLTFHYIREPEEMLRLYNYCQSNY